MTTSPDVPPLAAASLADAVAALRERGLRLSTSRRLVLEALFAADGPVSAEHVARRSSLDPASVHRNFETLERHGLVRHVHLGHGPGLYALLCRGENEYLYCERCGAVMALGRGEFDPVRKRIRDRYGYEARFDHFAVVGTCAACSQQGGRETGSRASTRSPRTTAREPHGRRHEHPHLPTHGHEDDVGVVHEQPRAEDERQRVVHEHLHSHGDQIHSHQHVHR